MFFAPGLSSEGKNFNIRIYLKIKNLKLKIIFFIPYNTQDSMYHQ